MRLFFPINDICYGLNSDAKLLCNQGNAIERFDVSTLQQLQNRVTTNGKAYNLLSGALVAYQAKVKTLSS